MDRPRSRIVREASRGTAADATWTVRGAGYPGPAVGYRTGDATGALKACETYFDLKDAPPSPARSAKAHFRAATALERLGRLYEAEEALVKAREHAPDDRGILRARQRVRAAREAKKAGVAKASFKGVFA